MHLIAQSAIQPIQTVKVQYLGSNNPRLHSDEVLIALAASANLDPKAARALEALAHLAVSPLVGGGQDDGAVGLTALKDVYKRQSLPGQRGRSPPP